MHTSIVVFRQKEKEQDLASAKRVTNQIVEFQAQEDTPFDRRHRKPCSRQISAPKAQRNSC